MSQAPHNSNILNNPDALASLRQENQALKEQVAELKRFIGEHSIDGEWVKSAEDAVGRKSIYRSAVEGIGLGLWEWSVATGDVFWSDLMSVIMGYEPGELEPSYDGFIERVHPDDREILLNNLNQHLEENTPYNATFRVRCKNGNYRWFNGRGEAQRDNDGKPISMVGSLEDIHERITTAQELEKERARYSAIFQQSKDAWLTLHPPHCKFSSCNQAALDLFHVETEDAFKQLGPWDISPEFQPDGELSEAKAKRAINQALETGTYSFEWTHCTSEGVEIPTNILLSRIDEGNSSYIHALARDISEEKKLAQELAASREGLELALDAGEVGMLEWDLINEGLQCDHRCYTMLGFSKESETLDHAHFKSLIHPEDRPELEAKIDDYFAKGSGIIEHTYRLRHKKGHWLDVMSRGCVLERDEDGTPLRHATILFDITVSKEREKDLSLILEKNEIGTWKYDPVNNHLEWGHSMFELYGVRRENFTSAYDAWSSCLHPDHLARAEKKLDKALESEDSFADVFAIVTEAG